MVQGACRLCLKQAVELRDSHIIPKWAYARVVADLPQPVQPVRISGGIALATSEQMKEHLLCSDCEQRFSDWEKVVGGLVFQEDGSCPWRTALDQVLAAPPNFAATVARATTVDADAVACFAASVLWRASVYSRLPNALGSSEEGFRAYLLGQSPFPADAWLLVTLVEPSGDVGWVERSLTAPKHERRDGYDLHWFALFGAKFDLFVGKRPPTGIAALCFARTKLVSRHDAPGFAKAVMSMIGGATAKGKLARTKAANKKR